MSSRFLGWIAAAILVSGCIGLTYLSGQQILRQAANDPQIQISEDTAHFLASGKPLPSSAFTPVVDIATSLSPYFVLYDDRGNPIGSTGLLDDKTPVIPMGVLDYAKEHGQNRVTWQPRPGVRSAIVVTHVEGGLGGYVAAGRSLREVEKREDQLLFFATSGWIASLIVIGLGFVLTFGKNTKRRS